jgi:hypothetical protein
MFYVYRVLDWSHKHNDCGTISLKCEWNTSDVHSSKTAVFLTGFFWLGIGSVAKCWEPSHKPAVSIEDREFLANCTTVSFSGMILEVVFFLSFFFKL